MRVTTTTDVHRGRWVALAALLVAEAMNLLDATITAVAAPTIRAGLAGTAADMQWFGAAYTLPFAVLLITGGRLGDRYGRKRVFTAGVVGFTLASAACALAPSVGVLVAARAVQGAAAAAVVPQTFGLIVATFTGRERSRALGLIGPVMGLAAICGPVLGAVVTRADLAGTSWRAAFLVNVPLALLVLAFVPAMREDAAQHPPAIDVVGTVLAVGGVALVTYPLIETRALWLAVVGVAALVGFALLQRARAARGRPTLVETSLFTTRAFSVALAASTLFFAVMNGLMLVVVLHAQLGLGRDVLAAGLTLLPWSAGSALASLLAGAVLVPRVGPRLALVGLGVLAAGLVATPVVLPVGLGVAGVGLGLFTVPFFTAALSRVEPHETGSAAGLLNAVQQLGATLGVAALPAVFLRRLGDGAGPALTTTVLVALGLVVLAGVATTIMLGPVRASGGLGGLFGRWGPLRR